MHIGIDNAVNGHGRRAADAVKLYLQNVRLEGGETAVKCAWRRIWNGFVAFGSLPFDPDRSFAEGLKRLITNKPSLRCQMIEMIRRKAPYGSRNHQEHKVGATRIDEWFADPSGFLDALEKDAWITAGDWANSRMKALMDFETGPMFRVFTDEEIALWASYTESLKAAPLPTPSPTVSPAQAMAAVIDQLRPVQSGTLGHSSNYLRDSDGVSHDVAWWFEQPTRSFMEALASPANSLITVGKPEQSRFYTSLIAPTGPMGSVFGIKARVPNGGTCRDVVRNWISDGCQIVLERSFTLMLSTPAPKRSLHPTGHLYGMGGIH
jgi:hypothetical protein